MLTLLLALFWFSGVNVLVRSFSSHAPRVFEMETQRHSVLSENARTRASFLRRSINKADIQIRSDKNETDTSACPPVPRIWQGGGGFHKTSYVVVLPVIILSSVVTIDVGYLSSSGIFVDILRIL